MLAGNVDLEQGTKNALAALELAGCDAPVYKGSDSRYDGEAISPYSVFGSDGMGDRDLIHPEGQAQEKDAIDFILDTVRANPGEIEIVMLGPATNIARCMDRDPEAMKQVKMIWSMGTTGNSGAGNATPVSEFNVYLDAPAYRRVLEFGAPVTIVGLDVCGGDSMWSDLHFDKLYESGDIGRFVTDSFASIREYYAQNGSAGLVSNCDAAAVLMDSGAVYTGVNVENASSPAGSCAEQNAISHAVRNGERRIVAIAIVGGANYEIHDYCAPCGICRQVMREFCDPKDMRVIIARSVDDYKEMSLEELLPESFGPEALNK